MRAQSCRQSAVLQQTFMAEALTDEHGKQDYSRARWYLQSQQVAVGASAQRTCAPSQP